MKKERGGSFAKECKAQDNRNHSLVNKSTGLSTDNVKQSVQPSIHGKLEHLKSFSKKQNILSDPKCGNIRTAVRKLVVAASRRYSRFRFLNHSLSWLDNSSKQSTAPVSQKSWVRIPFKP